MCGTHNAFALNDGCFAFGIEENRRDMIQPFSWQFLVTSNFLDNHFLLLYPLAPFSCHFLNCQTCSTLPMSHTLSCPYGLGTRIHSYTYAYFINSGLIVNYKFISLMLKFCFMHIRGELIWWRARRGTCTLLVCLRWKQKSLRKVKHQHLSSATLSLDSRSRSLKEKPIFFKQTIPFFKGVQS